MTKRRLAWIALFFVGATAVLAGVWSAFGLDKIVLSAAELQRRVNRELPRTFKGVTVTQATVAVADGDMTLTIPVAAEELGQRFNATVSARGVPDYDSERGEIFFDADDVKVSDFAATGGKLAERLDRLSGGLRKHAEKAAGEVIEKGLKAYLAERPVYRFKDDFKGFALRAVITDVSVDADALVVAISLINLTVTAAASLAALLVVGILIILLVRHPRWGLTIVDLALTKPSAQ
jgi:hypothetical protein